MLSMLVTGVLLGLSAGLAPGPLLVLVITESLRHGIKAGIKVAMVPVVSDVPIITVTFFLVLNLSGFHTVLGIISFIGGAFLLYMAYECMQTGGLVISTGDCRPDSFRRGLIVNLLNPHPYLFWLSVGGPLISRALVQNVISAFAFIGSFYLVLVGSKIILACVVGRSRSFLTEAIYLSIMKILGLLLLALAVFLFHDGLELLGYSLAE